MNLQESIIYLKLKKERSVALRRFLEENYPESGLTSSLLEAIRQEEESLKGLKITPCVVLDIEQALDLEVMLKKELLPGSKDDWTPLHSIRMSLLESITAHFRHVPMEVKDALLEHRQDSAFA